MRESYRGPPMWRALVEVQGSASATKYIVIIAWGSPFRLLVDLLRAVGRGGPRRPLRRFLEHLGQARQRLGMGGQERPDPLDRLQPVLQTERQLPARLFLRRPKREPCADQKARVHALVELDGDSHKKGLRSLVGDGRKDSKIRYNHAIEDRAGWHHGDHACSGAAPRPGAVTA